MTYVPLVVADETIGDYGDVTISCLTELIMLLTRSDSKINFLFRLNEGDMKRRQLDISEVLNSIVSESIRKVHVP